MSFAQENRFMIVVTRLLKMDGDEAIVSSKWLKNFGSIYHFISAEKLNKMYLSEKNFKFFSSVVVFTVISSL